MVEEVAGVRKICEIRQQNRDGMTMLWPREQLRDEAAVTSVKEEKEKHWK